MIFRNGTHAEEWAAAIYRADAHRDDDTANPYFGASLFLSRRFRACMTG